MQDYKCHRCNEDLPEDAFRKNAKGVCTWCEWSDPEKRAKARYRDKVVADRKRKGSDKRVNISEEKFISWYIGQDDTCHYCGVTLEEIKRLRLKRGMFGYFVSWDIDRKDSSKPYKEGNMVLSCFMCNMAKVSYFTEGEGRLLGQAVRKIIEARLAEVAN
ncbi:hypothetical protein [Alcanivorax sp.]|jgi:DNA-directed RNA polymerase subunit RPC12/RpoP|uniref:hypothetical protein n=1 Tax=Alcanivorax sp. TaxID=1872427 RepID=UPI0032D8CCA6